MKIANKDYNLMELDLSSATIEVNSTTLVTGMTKSLVDEINELGKNGYTLRVVMKAHLAGAEPTTEDISINMSPVTTSFAKEVFFYGRGWFNGSTRNMRMTFTSSQTVYLELS